MSPSVLQVLTVLMHVSAGPKRRATNRDRDL